MKCRYSENDVALYVEGDLAASKAQQFEAHLSSKVACESCRELVAELRESQSVFKSLGQDGHEVVNASALAHVRTRVLAEVGGRARVGWGRWVYAIAGMAFAVVLGVGLVRHGLKPEAKQIVKVDPLPVAALPAVPLERGTLTMTMTPTPKALPKPARKAARPAQVNVDAGHVDVPLPEGVDPSQPPDPPKQIVVKLLTDDPNIVIYWLVDPKTDQKNGGAL